MSKYIVLINFTEQGMKKIKNLPKRVQAARKAIEKAGGLFSGMSPDGELPEIYELPDHPWFIGVQYHPELKSKPFEPQTLFSSFIAAAVAQSRLV